MKLCSCCLCVSPASPASLEKPSRTGFAFGRWLSENRETMGEVFSPLLLGFPERCSVSYLSAAVAPYWRAPALLAQEHVLHGRSQWSSLWQALHPGKTLFRHTSKFSIGVAAINPVDGKILEGTNNCEQPPVPVRIVLGPTQLRSSSHNSVVYLRTD